MKYSVVVVIMVVIAKPLNAVASTDLTTKEYTTLKPTTTTATPLNDCPYGWIYSEALGCIFFNTDQNKVLTYY